jgi:hypothetical protein
MAFIPAVPTESGLVTVKQLADFLKAPDYADREQPEHANLVEALTAALEWVEQQVGPLDSVARDYTVYPSGRSLVLPDTHLVSVGTITDPRGDVVALPADVNLLAGIITFRHRLHTGAWTVRATSREHGTSVALAVKIIASHLYTVHRGANLTGPRFEGFAPVDDPAPEAPRGGSGFAIPRRAAQLLAPFRRPRGLA